MAREYAVSIPVCKYNEMYVSTPLWAWEYDASIPRCKYEKMYVSMSLWQGSMMVDWHVSMKKCMFVCHFEHGSYL